MHSNKLSPGNFLLISCLIGISSAAIAEPSQKQMLSGVGKDDAVPWDFFCSTGKGSGVWTKIPVPSCWELQGFGIFNYGNKERNPKQPTVEGKYRRSFTVPAAWAAKRVFLVFDASMTDTEVFVNGIAAGPKHQGAFYQFRYEITKLIHADGENKLEVNVTDESSDASINRAERRADYWNFGGIFRPVYLEAVPQEFIEHQAIDARADGSFAADITVSEFAKATSVEAQIFSSDSKPEGPAFSAPLSAGKTLVKLHSRLITPRLWTAETPNLYKVVVRLKSGSTVIHEVERAFGFRTFEVRDKDGLYLNGHRIFLKGACRHSFWPDSGRTTSPELGQRDIALLKEMNMNAVRMSHYPPDEHFLDQCDREGIYVLDELAGWQKKYDTEIGRKLVAEMVPRDVNHPSILFWDNGNEGGWNTELDGEFSKYDPQQRRVLHPWAISGGLNTKHYPNWDKLQALGSGEMLWMPTEFLHGLDDGGAGAGLDDYFELMRHSKTCVGGFIWSFIDEGVKRPDWNGSIDTKGNNAPDGILGPYREKEGSFFTIKQIWSPVIFAEPKIDANFRGEVGVENRYSFVNLNQCKFSWQLRKFPKPEAKETGYKTLAEGVVAAPSVAPGGAGKIHLDLPKDWSKAEALSVKAEDWLGREVWTAVWPISGVVQAVPTVAPRGAAATATEGADSITLSAAGVSMEIDKNTGQLSQVTRQGKPFSLKNGPRLAAGESKLEKISFSVRGSDAVVECSYSGAMNSVRWTLDPAGSAKLEYIYQLTGNYPYLGVTFDYPPAQVKALKWLGNGPYRVYKNRLKGGVLNVWENQYNDAITGRTWGGGPEFKGYFSNIRWAKLVTNEGDLTVKIDDEGLYLRVLTPNHAKDVGKARAEYPAGDLSFLHGISAVGSKFAGPELTGPSSQLNAASGSYRATIHFEFGGAN